METLHEFQPRYDAIVVGARCAGAATAFLLARAGARVLLIDRQGIDGPRGAQVQVGVLEDEFLEADVFVGETAVNFLLFAETSQALLPTEYQDRERQAKRDADEAEQFPFIP